MAYSFGNKDRKLTSAPSDSRLGQYFSGFAVGVILGLFVIGIHGLEMRWLAYYILLFIGLFLFLANNKKEAVLVAIFFLSFQIEVYIRLFFGHAGTAGIEIPLVTFCALALLGWYLIAYGYSKLSTFNWAGSLGLPIVILFCTSLISLLFTTERFVGITRIAFELQLIFIYWLAFNIVNSKKDLENILKYLFVTLALQSIIYYIQSALGITFSLTGEVFDESEVIPRPGGTVSTNPAGYASFMTPIFLISFSLYLAKTHNFQKRFLPILVLLGSAALVLTFTRAVWAGLVIGALMVIVMSVRRNNYHRRRLLLVITAMLVSTIIFVPIMINKRLSTQYQDEGALDERFRLILISINVIEENPVTGVGPGAYSHVYKKYLSPELAQGWLYEVHNEFLLRTAETGISGGIAFVLLIIAGLRQSILLSRSEDITIRVIAIGWFSGLVSLSWQMAWVPWRGFSYNAMLWLMLGLIDGTTKYLQRKQTASEY